MLGMKAQYNLANAEVYFKQHLRVGDYYTEGQIVLGQWQGEGARTLGLNGVTETDDFVKLCRNLHPETGQRLTQRQNGKRMEAGNDGSGRSVANRRVFYDFTLSPPKSVSIAALVGNDERIIQAHDEAVQMAFRQLEMYAATRVRKQGENSYRMTGNLVGAIFRHDTSRALDPHLHSHCIVFNATRDSVEDRWKALEACEMVAAKKFAENVYYHELTKALTRFGYRIQNKARGDFEVEGVSKELIDRFSKRHREIDEKTRAFLAKEPERAQGNLKDIRENIAYKERPRKIKDIGIARLQSLWNGQLSGEERDQLRRLDRIPPPLSEARRITAMQAVLWAEEHLFDRRSVVHEHDIWRHALEHARGQDVSLREIQAVTGQRGYVRDKKLPHRITTPEVLGQEWQIVRLAQNGIHRFGPIGFNPAEVNPALDEEQRQAVQHILSSRDFVTLFRGGAGTGKSYTLREIHSALKESGRVVHVLAPQRQQVNDLEREGFTLTQTVSGFLASQSMTRGAIVLVDEAGQIGGKQMFDLLRAINENDGRVILSGDTRQHGAVEATDALRAIEKYSGLEYAELTNIRRQNPHAARTEVERQWLAAYKLAVSEAQQGKLAQSFDRLDRHDAIVDCTLADQQEKLAAHYLELVKADHSTVVVSQSWTEVHKVNDRVREGLKAQGLIGRDDMSVLALERLDLTDAQKRDSRSFAPDAVIMFNRPVSGYKPNEAGHLLAIADKNLLVEANGRIRPIPFKYLDRLTVCQPKELRLSSGDRLQLKANGAAADGRKLANGELVTLKRIETDGRLTLTDGRVLEKSYRQFVRGYAVTSYAAQGKTVDYVLFSDAATKAATNDQQWYVTISRGRKGVKIFTADKIQLRQNVTHSGDRPLALDIAQPVEGYTRKLAAAWGRGIGFVFSVQHAQRRFSARRAEMMRQAETMEQSESMKQSVSVNGTEHVRRTESLRAKPTEAPKESETVRSSPAIRRAQRIIHRARQGPRYRGGMGV